MKTLLVLGLLAATLTSSGQALSDKALGKVSFDQNLGRRISMDLPFRDETGRTIRLGTYFGKRPVILVLGYYECPMLCSMVLNGMISGLQDVPLKINQDYDVVNVSIDPHETFALAAAKKNSYVTRFGRPSAAGGWHFLTGDEAPIRALAKEVGFNYVYDPASHQYAHPSGLVILTPDGTISHYLSGVVFSSDDLHKSLLDATQAKVGSPIAQFFLLCFHYSPLTGKYSGLVLGVVRVISLVTLAELVGLVATSLRRRRMGHAGG